MADWFLETGVYLLGVALIPGVGLLLVCSGLWRAQRGTSLVYALLPMLTGVSQGERQTQSLPGAVETSGVPLFSDHQTPNSLSDSVICATVSDW